MKRFYSPRFFSCSRSRHQKLVELTGGSELSSSVSCTTVEAGGGSVEVEFKSRLSLVLGSSALSSLGSTLHTDSFLEQQNFQDCLKNQITCARSNIGSLYSILIRSWRSQRITLVSVVRCNLNHIVFFVTAHEFLIWTSYILVVIVVTLWKSFSNF